MGWLKRLRWPQSLRWRYSLRALFVFITLFMLWGGYHAGRSWPERKAELVLRRHRTSIRYGPDRPESLSGYPVYAYQKLVQVLWGERFINHVALYESPKAEAVDALIALPHLEFLSVKPGVPRRYQGAFKGIEGAIPHDAIPDGSIARFLASHRMRGLEFEGVDLGDADLRAIAAHPSLTTISFFHSRLTEDGLAAIAALPRLNHLRFSHCNLTGVKLASVPGSSVLTFIECSEAPVGVEFAAFVSRCPNLRNVSFLGESNQAIDDNFVAALGPHPALLSLDLRLAKVTDQSVDTIANMPSLTCVVLPRETVSPAAMERLQKMRPSLLVSPY